MVTFPFSYSNLQDDPSVVLGLAPGSFQIVRFNPEIGAYEQVTEIKPGEGYWVRLLTVPPPPNNTQFVRFIDDAGNAAIILRGTGSAGQFRVESRTSGGSFTTLVTCSSVIDNALTQVDIFLDFSASGSVVVYKNSASACTYSGDTTNGDGATTITRVELGGTSTSFFGALSALSICAFVCAGSSSKFTPFFESTLRRFSSVFVSCL